MTFMWLEDILESAGYKNVESWPHPCARYYHPKIAIHGGRILKPQAWVYREIRTKLPCTIRLELRRVIRIFGKEITIWRIPNIGAWD